jgi:hypothetical protein
MSIIAIQHKPLLPWGTANGVEFKVDFSLGMQTFNIVAQFHDTGNPIGSPVVLNVNPGVLQAWGTEAALHPEKAGFLDFQIIRDWCLAQVDAEYIPQNPS